MKAGKGLAFNQRFYCPMPGGKTLVTTDHGGFALLSKLEMAELGKQKPEVKLLKKLEQSGIIVTKKNEKKIINRYRDRMDFLFGGTRLHIINPTLRCNQNCAYCYANAAADDRNNSALDMSKETAEKIVDFIMHSPAKSITIEFQGGEPLLRFDLIEFIVERVKEKNKGEKNILWNLVSNLNSMDEDKARFFAKNRFCVSTSLDGPKAVHEKNRPYLAAGSYESLITWIKRLKQEFKLPNVGLLPTITRSSLPHAKEIVELYASLGMKDIRPVVLRCIGRASKNWNRIGYSPEQYIKFWKEVVEYCIEKTRKGEPISEQTTVMILRKIYGKQFPNYTCFSMPCGAALMQVSYTPNGNIYTCDEGKGIELFQIGNVNENKYNETVNGPEALNMLQLSSGLLLPCSECVWHPYCGYCPVTTHALQGNPVSKLPLDFECKIKAGQIQFIFEKLLYSKDRGILLKWLKNAKI